MGRRSAKDCATPQDLDWMRTIPARKTWAGFALEGKAGRSGGLSKTHDADTARSKGSPATPYAASGGPCYRADLRWRVREEYVSPAYKRRSTWARRKKAKALDWIEKAYDERDTLCGERITLRKRSQRPRFQAL